MVRKIALENFMPATYHHSFQVRYYECDANGNMHNIDYLRRMQEAAFEASAAVGYDFACYNAIGHLWLVRETEIEYLKSLKYGDQAEIKTWVRDFRRFRSRRMYEFRNTDTGELVAQASTDWVFINSDILRPAAIPEDMQQAFFPEGAPKSDKPQDRFPSPKSIPENSFSISKKVKWIDLDMMWHVNNAIYLAYTNAAETSLLEAHGWATQRMLAEGFYIIPKQYRIEYRIPAILDDELEILVWHSELRPSIGFSNYQIIRPLDDQLLAQAQCRWMCADQKTGKSIDIPDNILKDLTG
jgi:acyl-CoA thioester hydrolase